MKISQGIFDESVEVRIHSRQGGVWSLIFRILLKYIDKCKTLS